MAHARPHDGVKISACFFRDAFNKHLLGLEKVRMLTQAGIKYWATKMPLVDDEGYDGLLVVGPALWDFPRCAPKALFPLIFAVFANAKVGCCPCGKSVALTAFHALWVCKSPRYDLSIARELPIATLLIPKRTPYTQLIKIQCFETIAGWLATPPGLSA